MLPTHTVGILQYNALSTELSRGGTTEVTTHQKTSFTTGENYKYGNYYAFTFVGKV